MRKMAQVKPDNWWWGKCGDCGTVFTAKIAELEMIGGARAAECENCGCYIDFYETNTAKASQIKCSLPSGDEWATGTPVMATLLSRIDKRIDRKWEYQGKPFRGVKREMIQRTIDMEREKARNRLMDNLEVLAFSDVATAEDIDSAMSD